MDRDHLYNAIHKCCLLIQRVIHNDHPQQLNINKLLSKNNKCNLLMHFIDFMEVIVKAQHNNCTIREQTSNIINIFVKSIQEPIFNQCIHNGELVDYKKLFNILNQYDSAFVHPNINKSIGIQSNSNNQQNSIPNDPITFDIGIFPFENNININNITIIK